MVATVMMYVRVPLSLRQVEDVLHERGIDISYETVRNIVEPVWAAIWFRDQKETVSVSAEVAAVEVATG